MMVVKCNHCWTAAPGRYTGHNWRCPLDWWVGVKTGLGEQHACSEACRAKIAKKFPELMWTFVDKKKLAGYNRARREQRIREVVRARQEKREDRG